MPSEPPPSVEGTEDRGRLLAGASGLFRLLAAVPGHRDDALAVVDGLFGDLLADAGSSLAVPMTIRAGGEALPLDREGLARAVPQPTGRLVVLVHGLMSTESVWRFRGAPDQTYGSLLARDHGVTALTVRYNTGRHISTNGRELSRLLHQLVAAWPVRVRELSLVGHSMGGLVVRSACYYAPQTRSARGLDRLRRSWTAKTRRVVLIGVPNTGAPLEAFVNLTSATLWALPIPATRLVGLGLDRRSAGIKDLRFGTIRDEDWIEQDPAARARPDGPRMRPLRRARYLVVAGTLTADPEHPLAQVVGDSLVTSRSASGLDETTGTSLFPGATVAVFPKVHHLALPNRQEVYDTIDRWWDATGA